MKILTHLADFCATLAGVLLTVITLMTCFSLIGRNTVGVTLVGDFELTSVVAGAAIALFLPWCQVRRGNIIVDFFTAKMTQRVNARLDRLGAFLLACVFAMLMWRVAVGGWSAYRSGSATMLLNFPEWVVYAVMVPALGLTSLIAFAQAIWGWTEVAE
ncbi:C4-dicarboxylate ABC transporter permease [Limnohabitans sp. MMS-10A-160]|nr:C4-dicarboxylate ABC transporter permease [Limnohabitans sp. MMS-10A-192]PUE22584.1 C4-dicarboxylate ABC transporter permease [Limnohabitans sp. MMS-10A-160]